MIVFETQFKIPLQWSFSRVKIFQECQRKYFFQHVVPFLPKDLLDPALRRNVLFLRRLTNRHLLLGNIIHQTISEILDTLNGLEIQSLNFWVNKAWMNFQNRVLFSRKEKYWIESPRHPDYTILFEDVYQLPLHDEILRHMYLKLKKALRNFLHSPVLNNLKQNHKIILLEKEKLDTFQLQQFPVWVKLDLLFRDQNNLHTLVD